MRQDILIIGLTALVLTIGSAPSMAASDIYRWVDDNGVVHFSEQPPNNPDVEKVDIRVDQSVTTSAPSEPEGDDFVDNTENATPTQTEVAQPATSAPAEAPPLSAAEKSRQARAESREKAAAERQKVEAKCQQANKIIAELEPTPNVITRDENGEMVRLDDDKRLDYLSKAQEYIAANCNK